MSTVTTAVNHSNSGLPAAVTNATKIGLILIYGSFFLAGLIADEAALTVRKSSIRSRRDAGGKHRIRFRTSGVLVICLLLTMFNGVTRADEPVYDIDIPSMNAAEALNRFAEQTGAIMLFPYDLASARQANAVSGRYTLLEGLDLLLRDTGLSGGLSDKRVVNISPTENEQRLAGEKGMSAQKVPLRRKITAFVASIFAASAASGQDTDVATQPLEEIIVTASKREQSLQDISMSITALGQEEIERQGLVGMADYLRAIPGVSHLDRGAGQNSTVIRGISVDPQLEVFSSGSTVATYFGEVPLSGLRWSAADIKLVDMERIEVLRGPQGTLYGSGSLGGTVRNIPVAPDPQTLEGEIRLGYSNTAGGGSDNYTLHGIINIPVVEDKIAIRAVAYNIENSGYIKNIGASDAVFAANAAGWGAGALAIDQDNVGNDEYTGGRITALWQPTDKLRTTLMYLTQDLSQDGWPEVDLARGSFLQARLQMGDSIGGSESLGDETDTVNLVLEYDFDWATLLSSSSWSEQVFRRAQDIAGLVGGIPVPQRTDAVTEGFNQEVRIVSQFDGNYQLLVGLYFEDIEHAWVQGASFGGDPSLNPFSDVFLLGIDSTTQLQQTAFFGELSYDITEQFTATLGARTFTYDKSTIDVRSGALFGGTTPTTLQSEESDVSYKFNMAYKLNDESLIYAQWAEGFRLGQPQPPLPLTCDADDDGIVDGLNVPISLSNIDSDYLDNYELGGKFVFLDSRLGINAAVYQIDWSGLPIVVFGDCGFPLRLNAGKAQSRGAELEMALYVAEGLQMDLGVAYVRAELSEDTPNLGEDGDRLPGSPKYNARVGLNYDFSIVGREAFIRGDYAYVGGFYNNLQEAGTEAGDYHQLNMRAGIALDNLSGELYVNNATNTDDLTWVDLVFSETRASRLRPRTIGFDVRYRF